MKIPPFQVLCSKIGKSHAYSVKTPSYNKQFSDRVKKIDQKKRKWDFDHGCWKIHYYELFNLIKIYRGSTKIHFDFGPDREGFLKLVSDFEKKEKLRIKKIEELKLKNKTANDLKKDLEVNYEKYRPQLNAAISLKKVRKKIPDFNLYPHQIAATIFSNHNGSALISLEMGLGKTLISIIHVEMMGYEKVLVITPNSLKFNYYNEVQLFSDSKAHIVNWKQNIYDIEESKYIIVNYDYFRNADRKKTKQKLDALNIGEIDATVCDESHKLKNNKSNTYKNYKALFKDVPNKLFLSGTPAPNRVSELYTILNQISPIDFKNMTQFKELYCGIKYDKSENKEVGGWTYDPNHSPLEQLFHRISPYSYRKRKSDVLKDLPDKVYNKVIIEMTPTEQKEYDKIEEGVVNDLFSGKPPEPQHILTIMLRLRQYTSKLKLSHVQELIERLVDEDEKVVVVDQFKESLTKLDNLLNVHSALHTGDQTVEERAEIVDQFQDPENELKVFLGSIQTCSYGLTLTESSKLFLLTLPFSVGEYDQVSDRCHRIGQKDTVFITPLIIQNSIDEYVFDLIEKKRWEITKALDNEEYVSDISESIIGELLDKFRKKYGK